MPEDLPKSWMVTTLDEVCLPVETTEPRSNPDREFTYFDISSIDGEANQIVAAKILLGRTAPSRARQLVKIDDVLFSTVRTYLKKIARVDQNYLNPIASTGFLVLRPGPCVVPEFLFHQVLWERFLRPIHVLQSGTSYPAVRPKDVLAQPFLLPPIGEQERILARLKSRLSRISAGELSTEQALEKIEQYRVSVTYAAVTGELTDAWRQEQKLCQPKPQILPEALIKHQSLGEEKHKILGGAKAPASDEREKSRLPARSIETSSLPLLPSEWAWATLESIAEIGSGITVSQNRYVDNALDIPYLRVANVLRGRLDLSEIKTIRVNSDKLDSYLLENGDVLFTEGGDRDKLGRGWIWESQLPKCLHQNHVFRARLFKFSLANAKIISHWGNTFGQNFFILRGTQSTNLASINRSDLAAMPIPIVPEEEQLILIRELDRRLDAINKLTETLNNQLIQAQISHQSLLNAAFTGRLVDANTRDEPITRLLQLTRSIKENGSSTVQRPKRKRTSKMKHVNSLQDLIRVLDTLAGVSTIETLLLSSGLGDDVEKFFDLLREGRDSGYLVVPVGESGVIKRKR